MAKLYFFGIRVGRLKFFKVTIAKFKIFTRTMRKDLWHNNERT